MRHQHRKVVLATLALSLLMLGSCAVALPAGASAGDAPRIAIQPRDTSAPLGSGTFLTAEADGSPSPREQWYSEIEGSSKWLKVPNGTGPSITVRATPKTNLTQYRAVFTNSHGSTTTKTVSVIVYQDMSTWAGYAETGSVFSAASAQWTVPTVRCAPKSNDESSQWVGIDGYEATKVEQLGTDADCVNGAATYSAWYEMWGDTAVGDGLQIVIPNAVDPGDVVSASVSFSGTTWTFVLTDLTQGWTSTNEAPSPSPAPPQASAEAIVERPVTCTGQKVCPTSTIANETPVTFTSLKLASRKPTSVFPTAVEFIDPGVATVAPGPLGNNGTSFTVTERLAAS